MNCNETLGYTVMAIFYEVDPSDVKKQTGDFGKVFKKTCKGKTNEVIGRWSQALAKVATIAGYHSSKSENDVKLIEKIVTDVSDKLFSSTRSRDFEGFVGIEAHMEKMEQVLDLGPDGLDEVKMIGIWGPPGIGKTTIARCVFNQHSGSFDLSVFMTNVKAMYTATVCSDDYDSKLNLQQKFLSQITNQREGFKITHLGAAEERLHDKRVLVVLDNVDQLVQLEALAKGTWWFGHGSRIIVTTQDQNLLRAHGINHVYRVGVPTNSLEIFSMYAFKQKSPPAGFEKLAWEATILAGELPLALRVIGSSFRGKNEQQWEDALPRLRSSLDGQIENILKFSYDALCERDKNLFLHLTCFFNNGTVESLEKYIVKMDFKQGLHVLVDKSLITIDSGYIEINSLLVQLGREIVRKEYCSEPGKYSVRMPRERQYLFDASDICEVLSDDTTDSSSVTGVDLNLYKMEDDELNLSGRSFERMSNLKFLRIDGYCDRFYCPQILNSISRKLSLLIWPWYPMPCLPTNFDPKSLAILRMRGSKLEKLWKGSKLLRNLKEMDLGDSKNLKELPDLLTATDLETLLLANCSSLVELPSSIENATSLQELNLSGCSSLVKLPSSIGNATCLQELNLAGCSSLVKLPSSIGNATNLLNLDFSYCSSLLELPSSIGNPTNLQKLDLSYCSSLLELPSSIGNATNLLNLDLSYCSSLLELPSSIGNATNLLNLDLSYCSSLVELPSSIGNATNLKNLDLSYCSSLLELPSSIGNATHLQYFILDYCSSLVELPSFIGNFPKLSMLTMKGCSGLKVLPININLKSLSMLDFTDCSLLKTFPEISTNIEDLCLGGTAIEQVLSSIRSWSRLKNLEISYSGTLKEYPHVFNIITKLHLTNTEIQEIGPWVKECSRLRRFVLKGMQKLVSLPQLPDSLEILDAENCVSLERLD